MSPPGPTFPDDPRFSRRLIDSVQDGIAVMSLTGVQLDVNDALCRMTGFSRDELVGTSAPYPYWPPEQVDVAMKTMQSMAGGNFHEFEFVCMQKDGTRFASLINPSPVFGEDGAPLCFVATVKDLRARQALERELRCANRFEAMSELAGHLAHELNNVLTLVYGSTALWLRKSPEGVDEAQDIFTAARRAAGLANKLLGMSQRQVALPRPIDAVQATRGLVPKLRALAGSLVAIDLSEAVDAAQVRIDPGHLEQILTHLIANAKSAMPAGGTVRIGLDRIGREAVLEITDEGTGMDEARLARVFEPAIVQRDGTSTLGFGLAIVNGLVRQSGGRVEVDSVLGRGTRVTLRLPLTEEAPPTPAREEPRIPGERATTVLVVDDEPAIRQLAVTMLRDAGYDALEAQDGDHALAALRAVGRRVAVVITDIVMPGMDGRELASRIRGESPDTAVVLSSGYPGDAVEQSDRGQRTFLAKPYTPEQLLECVAAQLR